MERDGPAEAAPSGAGPWEALRFHPINPFVVRWVERDAVVGAGRHAPRLRAAARVLVATHSAVVRQALEVPGGARTGKSQLGATELVR